MCVGGGACDLSGRRVTNDSASSMAISCVDISTVAGAATSCVAHVTMDAAGAGSSWHACPAANIAVCTGPGVS